MGFDYSDIAFRVATKASSDATKPYEPPNRATVEAGGGTAPTTGKAIPLFTGSVKLEGTPIWARLFRNSVNECRGDLAICFGQNIFLRPLTLSTVIIDDAIIYNRAGTEFIDPPDPVRFYDGTQTEADPLIVQVEGADKVPAWKGYCYAVFENILLADTYQAIVSDNGTLVNTNLTDACDETLNGIDLKPDKGTGLFYGLEFPMTRYPNIVTSDGCVVLNRVPVTVDPTFVGFYCDDLSVIPCTGLVVLTGQFGLFYDFPGISGMIPQSLIFDPVSGEVVYASSSQEAALSNYTAPGSSTSATVPTGYGVEYDFWYPLPGANRGYVGIRRYDRSDIAFNAVYAPKTLPLGPTSNIASGIFDLNDSTGGKDGDVILDPGGDPGHVRADDWHLVSRAAPTFIGLETSTALGWWVDEAPFVDDIIFAQQFSGSVDLAAYRQSGADILVYKLNHSDSGLATIQAVTISDDRTATGIAFSLNANVILLSTSPTDPESLEPDLIYEIGPGGEVSFQIPKGSVLVPDSNNMAAEDTSYLQSTDFKKIFKYDPGGDVTQIVDDPDATGPAIIDPIRNLIYLPTATGTVTKLIDATQTSDIAIADLITDICTLRGYDPSDLSLIGLSGLTCRGLKLTASVAVADLLSRIGLLYSFIFAETDGKLKFVRRRAADGSYTTDVALTDADLVEGQAKITAQRNSATKVLTSLELEWIDPDRDYELNGLMAYRTTGIFTGDPSARDEKLSVPLVLDATLARHLLFESFFAQVEAETRFQVTLPPEHLRIEPGSLISIDAGGAERLAVVRRTTHRTDLNTLDVEADAFMAQASTTIAGPGDLNPPGIDVGSGYGVYIHLDIPLIRPADFAGSTFARQYHGLTTRVIEDWAGADLYRSRDGSHFTKIIEYHYAPMTVARAVNALSQPEVLYAMDEDSALVIKVQSGDPVLFRTVTYVEQQNGLTLAAYGRPGAWELISWQTVTDNLDGTLTLTNLERGLYGTGLVFDDNGDNLDHQPGDQVCILEDLKTLSSLYGVGDIGIRERFGVVTPLRSISESGAVWAEMTGISVRPFVVANLIAEHVPGESTLQITWDACSTIPGIWRDDGSGPAMPEVYTYRLFINSHEFETTDTSFVWEDYGSELGPYALAHDEVDVTVQIISPAWGDGYELYTKGREAE